MYWEIIFLLAIVFVLTYDPKSRTLEKFVGQPTPLDKNVVLVSTSTLLATLSTVSSMWRQENQKKNVLEIANQAGRLYDQFVNLVGLLFLFKELNKTREEMTREKTFPEKGVPSSTVQLELNQRLECEAAEEKKEE